MWALINDPRLLDRPWAYKPVRCKERFYSLINWLHALASIKPINSLKTALWYAIGHVAYTQRMASTQIHEVLFLFSCHPFPTYFEKIPQRTATFLTLQCYGFWRPQAFAEDGGLTLMLWRSRPLPVTWLPRQGCCSVTSLLQLWCMSGRGGTPSGSRNFHTRRFPLPRQNRWGRYRLLAERVNTGHCFFPILNVFLRWCRYVSLSVSLTHTHARASVLAQAMKWCPLHLGPLTCKKR